MPQIALFAIFMLTVFPITLLGAGLSGDKLLSMQGIIHDMLTLNPAVLLRLIAWLILLIPLIWITVLIRQWRSLRQHGNGS